MDIFRKLDNVNDEELHPKFKLLRDEFYYRGAKEVLSSWVEGFEDRDNKITKEFQTTFHSSLWEFYLFAVFKELGWEIDFTRNRPDFIVKSPSEIYFEAVVSEIKAAGVPESNRTPEDTLDMLEPISTKSEFSKIIDEAIARHSNSIYSKYKKYVGYTDKNGKNKQGYRHLSWVNEANPFVIALGSYDQISYGREYVYSMMALLYGLYYNPENNTYSKVSSVVKPDTDSDIQVGIFTHDKLSDISAIVFCNTLTLGKLSAMSKSKQYDMAYVVNVRHDDESPHYKIHEVSTEHPELLLDGLYVFHNPYAKNPIDFDKVNKTGLLQYMYTDRGVSAEGAHCPIVARLAQPQIMFPEQMRELVKSTLATNYNREIAYDIV